MSINVIVVERNKKAYVKQLPGTTDSLKKEMGSGIEFVKLATDNSVVLVVTTNNTDFADMNRALYHPGSKKVAEVVCGKFLIVGVDDRDNITNLTNKQIRQYMSRFREPEIFKIRNDGEILAVKFSDVEKTKARKKEKRIISKGTVHSLETLRKSHEYQAKMHRAGKLLDKITDKMPEDLIFLLSDYVEAEIDFQRFLEKECFKAGVEFGTITKKKM